MKQINIYELQNTINKKENLRASIFQKVLSKCHTKIQNAASNEQYFVIYDVPEYVVGLPLYNLNKCIEYLVSQLKENGFTVEHKLPKLLVISWYPKLTDVPDQGSTQTQDASQLFLNYIPYKNDKGKFVLNVD